MNLNYEYRNETYYELPLLKTNTALECSPGGLAWKKDIKYFSIPGADETSLGADETSLGPEELKGKGLGAEFEDDAFNDISFLEIFAM